MKKKLFPYILVIVCLFFINFNTLMASAEDIEKTTEGGEELVQRTLDDDSEKLLLEKEEDMKMLVGFITNWRSAFSKLIVARNNKVNLSEDDLLEFAMADDLLEFHLELAKENFPEDLEMKTLVNEIENEIFHFASGNICGEDGSCEDRDGMIGSCIEELKEFERVMTEDEFMTARCLYEKVICKTDEDCKGKNPTVYRKGVCKDNACIDGDLENDRCEVASDCPLNPLYKTMICDEDNWCQVGEFADGRCTVASDCPLNNPLYKTMKCDKNNYCKGDKLADGRCEKDEHCVILPFYKLAICDKNNYCKGEGLEDGRCEVAGDCEILPLYKSMICDEDNWCQVGEFVDGRCEEDEHCDSFCSTNDEASRSCIKEENTCYCAPTDDFETAFVQWNLDALLNILDDERNFHLVETKIDLNELDKTKHIELMQECAKQKKRKIRRKLVDKYKKNNQRND